MDATGTVGEVVQVAWLYKTIATWGLGVIGLFLLAFAGFFHGRLKKLEENSVDKQMFNDKFGELDKRRTEHQKELVEKLSEVKGQVSGVFQQAVVIGQMQEQIKNLQAREIHLSGWKHKTVDPYIPAEIINNKKRLDDLERDLRRLNDLVRK